ncbi:hypothetical protein ACEWK1_27300, partial [Metabacillus sp. YM-086]
KQEQTDMKREQQETRQEVKDMKRDISGMKQDISEIKQDISEMKQDQKATQEDLTQVRLENEKYYNEINSRFSSVELDHEHTWEKTVQNEREISKLRKQFDLIDFT